MPKTSSEGQKLFEDNGFLGSGHEGQHNREGLLSRSAMAARKRKLRILLSPVAIACAFFDSQPKSCPAPASPTDMTRVALVTRKLVTPFAELEDTSILSPEPAELEDTSPNAVLANNARVRSSQCRATQAAVCHQFHTIHRPDLQFCCQLER
jgi:hypothetical protein